MRPNDWLYRNITKGKGNHHTPSTDGPVLVLEFLRPKQLTRYDMRLLFSCNRYDRILHTKTMPAAFFYMSSTSSQCPIKFCRLEHRADDPIRGSKTLCILSWRRIRTNVNSTSSFDIHHSIDCWLIKRDPEYIQKKKTLASASFFFSVPGRRTNKNLTNIAS